MTSLGRIHFIKLFSPEKKDEILLHKDLLSGVHKNDSMEYNTLLKRDFYVSLFLSCQKQLSVLT